MKTEGVEAVTTSTFGTRFLLVGLVPALVLVSYVTLLRLSGPPIQAPSLSDLVNNIQRLGLGQLLFLGAASLLLALVFYPLEFPMIQFLEGYWGISRLATV